MYDFSVDYVSSQILTVNPRSNYSQWICDGHDGQAASGKPIILSLDPINPFHPIKCHADFCLISLMMSRMKNMVYIKCAYSLLVMFLCGWCSVE